MRSEWLLPRLAFLSPVLGCAIFLGSWPAGEAWAQAPVVAYRVLPLDPNKCSDKRSREKSELLAPEKFDAAAVEAYYRECLFARLTQENAVMMNNAREELMNDIEMVERKSRGNAKMLDDYNKLLARLLSDILFTKDNAGNLCHPSARVVAAVAAGRLNRQPATSQSGGLPDPEGAKLLIRIYSPSENDGMVAAALTHFPRHWIWPGMDANMMELARKRFVSNTEAFLGAQKPGQRGTEEDAYLKELMIENLTIIATGEAESAKLAKPLLLSLITPAITGSKAESEWLQESALWSLGQLANPELPPEELRAVQKGTIEFIRSSLKSWKRRCDQTSSSVASGGYPGGRGGPGGPGGPGGGLGGLGGGGSGMGDDGGGGKSGEGGRPGAPGGGGSRPKNPYDEQPTEVKNARRMLQQRLERIHYGLNGYGKAGSGEVTKGLVAWAGEEQKAKWLDLVTQVEALQKSLNEESISSLDTLQTSTRGPIRDLLKACEEIAGADAAAMAEVPAPAEGDSGADPGDSGNSGK